MSSVEPFARVKVASPHSAVNDSVSVLLLSGPAEKVVVTLPIEG
jgi:hypothetical protein